LLADVLLGPKGTLVERPFGALIDDRALGAIERRAVKIALENVLPDLRPDGLQAEAKIRQDRIVAAQAVPLLQQVPDAQGAEGSAENPGDEKEAPPGGKRREDRRSRYAQAKRDIPHFPLPQLAPVAHSQQTCHKMMKVGLP
jgi:hypothetical protein